MTPGLYSREEEMGEVLDHISHRYWQLVYRNVHTFALFHIKPLSVSILFLLHKKKKKQ